MTGRTYPEYQRAPEAWMGEVPAHWGLERMKYGLTEKATKKGADLPPGAISYGKVVTKDAEKISPETRATYQEVLAGEYLINPINLNYDLVSLRTALSEMDVCVSPAYIVLRAVPEKVHPVFGNYVLHVFDVCHMKTLGAGVRQTITFKDIGQCVWPLPPMEEQTAIARFLDRETSRIDGLIEKKTRFIALLKEKRATDVIEAISPKEGWNRFPFWSVAKSKSISGRPDEGLLSVYLDRGVIPYSEGGGLVHKPAESLEKYQLVEPGDLVMNNQQAWRGSLGVSLHRGIVSPAYLVLKLDREKVDPTFANYMFRARPYVEKFMLASMSVGDIQRQIKWPHLRIVPVVVPSVTEQREIAERLDSEGRRIDDLITLTERSIDLLREKRAALITAAVTGKIDVRAAA